MEKCIFDCACGHYEAVALASKEASALQAVLRFEMQQHVPIVWLEQHDMEHNKGIRAGKNSVKQAHSKNSVIPNSKEMILSGGQSKGAVLRAIEFRVIIICVMKVTMIFSFVHYFCSFFSSLSCTTKSIYRIHPAHFLRNTSM